LRGEERAFVTVYDRYAQRLLTYAYRRTGSSQHAEDAVSLVMLETWRRRREVRFGSDGTIAGWLFRTARYVLANDARTGRCHRRADLWITFLMLWVLPLVVLARGPR